MDFIIDTAGDNGLQEAEELFIKDEKPYFIVASAFNRAKAAGGGSIILVKNSVTFKERKDLSACSVERVCEIASAEMGKEEKLQCILELFTNTKEQMDSKILQEEELQKRLDPKTDIMFETFFDEMNWNSPLVKKLKKKPKMFNFDQLDIETGKLKSQLGVVDVDKEMKKSVLQPGFEKEHRLKKYDVSERKLKLMRKKERAKTTGASWFNLPAPEVTEELKNDLQILKMRSVMDPKHFYKKNDMEVLPKYFQVGTVMDSSLDHVNERLTRKDRKRTMVDELLADSEFQKYNKRKYKEIIVEKRKTEYKTFMKDKRQKNKAELKKNKVNGKKSKK